MKNLQLTKLGFLLFLILLCGCSDHFVIDTPAEAGNSYESDVHVLNKFVDISEPGQKLQSLLKWRTAISCCAI